MKTSELYTELRHRNALLAYGGLFFLVVAALCLVLMPFDGRQVMGINPWIKPMKFNLSITIYLWTLGWLLHYIRNRFPRSVTFTSWFLIGFSVVEIGCITIQAARGVHSHFNIASPFDIAIFNSMGIAIMLNTLLIVYVLILFIRHSPGIGQAYLWGIRLGLFVFLLGSLVGVVMVMNNAHSVGVADGGAGLPFLNWSREGGDLRAAHFIGMHALQLFPFVGFLMQRNQGRLGNLSPALLTLVFCIGYMVLTFIIFNQAMHGQPLVGMK